MKNSKEQDLYVIKNQKNNTKQEPFKVFETENDFNDFLNQKLQEETNKINDLTSSFEKNKQEIEFLKLEKTNWETKFKKLVATEWESMPVSKKDLNWEKFNYSFIDPTNLKQSLIKYADNNKLLIKEEQQENKEQTNTMNKFNIKNGVIL